MSLDISVRRYAVRTLGLLAVYDKHLMIENLEIINKVKLRKLFVFFVYLLMKLGGRK